MITWLDDDKSHIKPFTLQLTLFRKNVLGYSSTFQEGTTDLL